MKAILVIDVPKNFKKGRADCLIYEDKKPYRMWNRILQVKPIPKKEDIYERIYQAYGNGKDEIYKRIRQEVEDIYDEILGEE